MFNANELPRKPESDADEILMRVQKMTQLITLHAQLYKSFIETACGELVKINELATTLDGDAKEADIADRAAGKRIQQGLARQLKRVADEKKGIRVDDEKEARAEIKTRKAASVRARKAWKTRKANAKKAMAAAKAK